MIVEGSRRNRRSILHWPEPEKNADEAQMRGAISPLTLADLINEDEVNVHSMVVLLSLELMLTPPLSRTTLVTSVTKKRYLQHLKQMRML